MRINIVADQNEVKPTEEEKHEYYEMLMKDMEFLLEFLKTFFSNTNIQQHLVNSLYATTKLLTDENTFKEITDFYLTYQTSINENEKEFFDRYEKIFKKS